MFKLVIQDDEGKTTVVPLIRDEITIGRKEGNTIRLTERNVSRRHARILRNNGEVQIEDLGSYNGIRVNNSRIAERVSLRISDQVQIGDYKLYLKAEGVEQVDDARTMPIERIENGTATDVMAAMPGPPTTQQMPLPPTPVVGGTPPPAGLDADGRPVATAAQVAALTSPTGYGKLVVVSSNFAGKEFELTRPHMVIGRTDDNDLVINHRSISRNHAKITRDTETGRYTISDLQSSNGVRVNAQDYGKVELRRGDMVDLGHVRLRFVEPGEEFVFDRERHLADVTDTGGEGRGLMVAIVLGVLVLAVGAAFFIFGRGGSSGGNKDDSKSGSGMVASGSQTQVASGSDTANANGSGSAGSAIVPTIAPADAAETAPQPGSAGSGGNDDTNQLSIQCTSYAADKKWDDLDKCAGQLGAHDATAASVFRVQAKHERANAEQLKNLENAIGAKPSNAAKAHKAFDLIDEDSVYKKQGKDEYTTFKKPLIVQLHDKAMTLKLQKRCSELEGLQQQVRQSFGADDADAAPILQIPCDAPQVANPEPHPVTVRPPAGSGSSVTVTPITPPPSSCDADALVTAGHALIAKGEHASALASFESAYQCKGDPFAAKLAFMEACRSHNSGKAKLYYNKLSTSSQQQLAQMCISENVTYK